MLEVKGKSWGADIIQWAEFAGGISTRTKSCVPLTTHTPSLTPYPTCLYLPQTPPLPPPFTPQVHGGGLRHIRTDRRINEWRVPGRRTIQHAATNTRQVAVSMSGGCT
jgi:hypothetical protein